jgi:hypothetical protein
MIFLQEEDGQMKRSRKDEKQIGRKRSKKDVREQKHNKRCKKDKEVVRRRLLDVEVFY